MLEQLRELLDKDEAAIQEYLEHRAGRTPCINYENDDPVNYSEYDSCWRHIETVKACRYSGDPQFGLADIAAKRQILDKYERAHENRRAHPGDLASAGAVLALHGVIRILASEYTAAS